MTRKKQFVIPNKVRGLGQTEPLPAIRICHVAQSPAVSYSRHYFHLFQC